MNDSIQAEMLRTVNDLAEAIKENNNTIKEMVVDLKEEVADLKEDNKVIKVAISDLKRDVEGLKKEVKQNEINRLNDKEEMQDMFLILQEVVEREVED